MRGFFFFFLFCLPTCWFHQRCPHCCPIHSLFHLSFHLTCLFTRHFHGFSFPLHQLSLWFTFPLPASSVAFVYLAFICPYLSAIFLHPARPEVAIFPICLRKQLRAKCAFQASSTRSPPIIIDQGLSLSASLSKPYSLTPPKSVSPRRREQGESPGQFCWLSSSHKCEGGIKSGPSSR